MTVQELFEALEDILMNEEIDEDANIRIAHQPSYPLENRVGQLLVSVDHDNVPTLYIVDGGQVGYLNGETAIELGW